MWTQNTIYIHSQETISRNLERRFEDFILVKINIYNNKV